MTKKTFTPFRLEDLTGGINVRDYESEIDDKQVVDLINYNFSGNKLVSEKGSTDSGLPVTANIGALTIDSGDIWTVSAGDIKKNGTIVAGGVGILVTTSLQTFKPGIAFYITIEGIPYTITGNTVADFIFNLKTAVEANGLITVSQDDIILIKKADGSAITYSVTSNQSYILYNQDNTASYVFGKDYIFAIEINGILYEGIYTPSSNILNGGQMDIELMTQLEAMLPVGLGSSNVFMNSIFEVEDDYSNNAGIIINNVSSVIEHRDRYYEYRVNGYISRTGAFYNPVATSLTVNGTVINGPYLYRIYDDGTTASVNLSGAWNISINLEGNIFSYSTVSADRQTMVSALISSINAHGSYTAFQGAGSIALTTYSITVYKNTGLAMSSISVTDTTPDIYYSGAFQDIRHQYNGNVWVNNAGILALYKSLILSQLNAISGITAIETTKDAVLGIYFKKNIYEQCTIIDTGASDDLDITVVEKVGVEIRKHAYDEVIPLVRPLSTGTGLNGRSNITIGNLGNLVVDKDVGGAYYSYDNLKVKIAEDAVGLPTVGTIYNGKIVLGGFQGNDNIIFSKTSSPTQPLNVLNFTDYSAGGQSVSGGDKGLVTGMMVGENGLYVFKDNSIWYTNSEKDDPTSNSFNFIFNKITSSGALTQNTITEVQQEIFYLDWRTRAVRRLGYEQNLTTLRDTAISDEIRPLIEALPEDQKLATSQFSYPNYMLSLSDHTGGTITYPNGQTFHRNNIHFIYNVDNKSWTRRTGIVALVSDKGYYVGSDGKVYKDFQGNTGEDSILMSKLYTFGDDVMYKKYGQLDIIGKTIGAKDITVEIYIDGEKVDERTYNYNNSQIREKIDMYDVGQGIQWKITASGAGKIELYDIQVKWKPTTIQPQDYL